MPSRAGGQVTPAMLDLLRALHQAVVLPLPATGGEDQAKYYRLATRRLASAAAILGGLATGGTWNAAQLRGQARLVREWTGEQPVTYAIYQDTPNSTQEDT